MTVLEKAKLRAKGLQITGYGLQESDPMPAAFPFFGIALSGVVCAKTPACRLAIAGGPSGDRPVLVEAAPEPGEGGVKYLRDASFRQVEYPADLSQRKAFEIVEGGDDPFFFSEAPYGRHQARPDLRHRRRGGRVRSGVVSDQVVQSADRPSLGIRTAFEGPHLGPRVLVEKLPVFGDADAETPHQLGLRRRPAQLLHQLVPGAVDLVRPEARATREGIGLSQLVQDRPSDLGNGVRLELGLAPRVEGLDRPE